MDCYENRYKFRKKSVYNRKYHVRNQLFSIEGENNLQLIPDQFNKISDVLKLLDPIKFQRKRMIIIRFIIKKLFNMMHIDANIKITILRRTLKKYEEYWKFVMKTEMEDIRKIMGL